MLKEAGYSLQGNSKRLEGRYYLDGNEQFMYINKKTESYIAHGYPAISVDTKKKELIGKFKNNGRQYYPQKHLGSMRSMILAIKRLLHTGFMI